MESIDDHSTLWHQIWPTGARYLPWETVQLLVCIFLRIPGGIYMCHYFELRFLGIQLIRSIPSVWCSGSNCHLTPKQCIKVWESDASCFCAAMFRHVSQDTDRCCGGNNEVFPCFLDSNVFQKMWRRRSNMTSIHCIRLNIRKKARKSHFSFKSYVSHVSILMYCTVHTLCKCMDEHCQGPKSKPECNSVALSVEKITTGTEKIKLIIH